MYLNLWLRQARAGFSSQRGAAIKRRRDGAARLRALQFSHRVCCALKTFFKEIDLKSGCTDSVENLRLNGAT